MAFEISDKWRDQAKDQSASSKQLWLINSIVSNFPHFKNDVDITLPLNKLDASEIITKLKELEKGVKAK
tara:strand:+ start:1098 stop:1304 length:207 start_codon:yes stop_codon:yes gene_type:complete